ncbi:hypothetical protein EmuJ_000741300 [Echinococcus multilocularis]|uniref:Uncharacterized protein n=1 Tax=Echinococcus multilocularis TaxID=6211 RepID=A0A068Y9C2_ECHMU|nr:hypothetical protein EmuJ_000741300 [Echinococcus multilocularis]
MNRKRYAKPRIVHSFQSAINSGGKQEKIEPSQCNDLYFLKWFGVLHHKAIAATRKPYHKIDDKKVSIPKAPENKDKSQIRKKTLLNAAQTTWTWEQKRRISTLCDWNSHLMDIPTYFLAK